MEVDLEVPVFVSMVMLSIVGMVLRLYYSLVVKPHKLRSILRKQGINGPTPTLFLGNVKEMNNTLSATVKDPTNGHPLTHNCSALLFPFLQQWRKQYGENFAFSLGNTQIMCANQGEIVKEMITCTSLDLGKPSYQHKAFGPLLGQGILTSNGSVWSHHRKILAPHLYMDKVKRMTSLITDSATALVSSWTERIETAGGGVADIKIDEGMRSFSGDVISRACFGSNYSDGEQIFLKLRALQQAMSENRLFMGIPGIRYFPTENNRKAWKLEKEIKELILQVVNQRKEGGYGADLLQMVLETAKDSNLTNDETNRFIVDNCKNIYLAGFETTAVAASWILMLLAVNQEWQERVRAEILECGTHFPTPDSLRKMKQLTMVIYESLRLYPPVSVMSREVFNDTRFGGINIPKGVNIWILATTLHSDPEIWGPDSYTFNPNRFSNGVTGACKFPHLFMPFGVGPRICLGQNLAMVELKILISMIISNFSFSLSPNYVHSPALRLVIEPEFGVDLLIRKL